MAVFKYTVANKEGKKLSGSVEAENETKARSELNNLGFSILELSEIQTGKVMKEEEGKSKQKYSFEARNGQGQNVSGTIASQDEFKAYKRLNKEYKLEVSALWKSGIGAQEVENSRIRGVRHLEELMKDEDEEQQIDQEIKSQEREKKELIVHTEVEKVLKKVSDLIVEYEKYIEPDQKKEIDKKIDKLLRIKNSNNLEYIVESTEELLGFIRKQEAELKKKGHLDKRTKLQIRVKEMISNLHRSTKPKSLSEDVVDRIQRWQQKHTRKASKVNFFTNATNNILTTIKDLFTTPEPIKVVKEQILATNHQLFEYVKMYFKEPTPEYKAKVKTAIKIIWNKRNKLKRTLKETKKRLKGEKKTNETKREGGLFSHLTGDLSEFTGWLLAFYLIYYFVAIYITTKNFGLGDPASFPKSLHFHNTQVFKYLLVVIFLVHIALSLKINFFHKSKLAGIVIFPLTLIAVVFTIVNF